MSKISFQKFWSVAENGVLRERMNEVHALSPQRWFRQKISAWNRETRFWNLSHARTRSTAVQCGGNRRSGKRGIGEPMKSTFNRLFILTALFALWTLTALGQSTSATLSGIVSDPQGASIANASVSITQISTHQARRVSTDASGSYSIPNLDIGAYSVSASAPGFKSMLIPSITLQVNQKAELNLTLQIGAVTDEVTVTTTLPLADTESSAVGQVIENRSIESLALNGRQFWQLTSLVPGATYTPGGQQISRGELLAALVVQRHPAHQLQGVACLWRHDVIVAAPTYAAGNIAQFGVEPGRLSGIQDPIERGFENCVVAQRGENRLPRQ